VEEEEEEEEEDEIVFDGDLRTVVTSCINVQKIRSSNPKSVLLVTQTPDMWQ
jgi:hypothetical protein